MIAIVESRNGIRIRLTEERWNHIVTGHSELSEWQDEVLDTVRNPTRILAGGAEELLAVREVESQKWLVVVYREFNDDGFIITAFLTRRAQFLDRREGIWP